MKPAFSKLAGAARDLASGLFPFKCPGCGCSSATLVCPRCERGIRALGEPYCRVCGRQLPPGAGKTDGCRECDGVDLPFDICRSVFLYETPVDGLIKSFKFKRNIHSGKYLCGKTAELAAARPDFFEPLMGADAIVPAPLHPFRLIWRGFNQSDIIAASAAAMFGAPVKKALQRVRHTKQQSFLPAKERPGNVKGAFSVKNPGAVAGKKIILVDDVMTTGATIKECSRTLKEAGAREVIAFTLARGI